MATAWHQHCAASSPQAMAHWLWAPHSGQRVLGVSGGLFMIRLITASGHCMCLAGRCKPAAYQQALRSIRVGMEDFTTIFAPRPVIETSQSCRRFVIPARHSLGYTGGV